MKKHIQLLVVTLLVVSCKGYQDKTYSSDKEVAVTERNLTKPLSDTVKIANEELEYEVVIIDVGFSSWLASTARPRGYYSESYLESRNNIYVTEWNSRVNQPSRYNPNLYEMRIDYERNTHYGYEVNYLIYNYFVYFQLKHNQRLAGFVPRP